MPSKPRPKTFIATRDFSCAGQRYRVGEVIPPSVALAQALRHGMATEDRKDKTNIQADESADQPEATTPDTLDGTPGEPTQDNHKE